VRILLVEDERGIADFVDRALRSQGHDVEVATDGPNGERRALDGDHDLVILDVMLPGRSGLEILEEIRTVKPALPVIMLTARGEVADRVRGLDLGATDYLGKPFAFAELLARIRARTRRPAQNGAPASTLSVGSVTLDLLSREAEIDGGRIELSAREFALLAYLMRHPGQVLSRQQILNGVWGYTFDPRSNLVDVYIGYLRRKLSANGSSPIETVRGMGYRMAREKPA